MKKTTGKLIVIEGGDGAGKATQAELLIKALKARGVKVAYFDFPQYDTFFGGLTGRALKGEFGDFRHLSPYMASLPYMMDRSFARDALLKALKDGIVICNRYTSSSTVFQSTKLSGKARKDFITFQERAEYDEIGLPRPALVIYLNVPPSFSFEMIAQKAARNYMGKKNGSRDQHEQDRDYQIAVVKNYLSFTKTRNNWKRIDCLKGGKLLPRETIHDMVLETVDQVLR